MTFEELLPNGSVITAERSDKKFMIIGNTFQDSNGDLFDYAACLYPEGATEIDKLYYLNNEDIKSIHFIGYQDASQLSYQIETMSAWRNLKKEKELKK